MRFHHLAVLVSDLARAEGFYVGVLGLQVIRRAPHSFWVGLDAGGFLAVELGDGPRLHCVALGIGKDAREAWRSRVTVERETPYTLYTRDPDGNGVALSHWPDAV